MNPDDFFEEVKIYRPKPGDTIVLRSKKRLSMEVMAKISDQLGRRFPDQKILVLDDGMELEVIESCPTG